MINQFAPMKPGNSSFLEIIAQEPEPMPLSTSNPSNISDNNYDEIDCIDFAELNN
jgi:hypothetical protein